MRNALDDASVEQTASQPDHSLVLYYQSSSITMKDEYITKIEADANTEFKRCDSWLSLMSFLTTTSEYPSMILIDSEALVSANYTISELLSMLSTFYRCSKVNKDLCVSIVIDRSVTLKMIKCIQQSEIMGIVPDPLAFGYASTISSVTDMLALRRHWPSQIVSTITDVQPIRRTKNGITLTCKQRDVFNLISHRGLSNKKIASALNISESTVKAHVSAILKAYGVRSRTQLVLAAAKTPSP